jgi:DNA-binding LacI/PurR family transcriptional regulator
MPPSPAKSFRKDRLRRPIHESVAEDLKRFAARKEVGERIETELLLAKRYGTSIPTIRNAVLLLEREGVLQRRQGSGTYVTGRGTGSASPAICISLSVHLLHYPATCDFHLRQAHEIYRQLVEKGMIARIVLHDVDSGSGNAELEEFLSNPGARCLIALSPLPSEIIGAAGVRGIPVIGAGDAFMNPWRIDYGEFVRIALGEIAALGGRRVALLGYGLENGQIDKGKFLSVAASHRLETRDCWIIADLPPKEISSGWAAFREIWSASSDRPDSLIISDGALLPGALQAMRDLGISQPESLCIVAHGNSPEVLPSHAEGITRLWYSIPEFAEGYVKAVEALLSGKPVRPSKLIVPRIERPAPRKTATR